MSRLQFALLLVLLLAIFAVGGLIFYFGRVSSTSIDVSKDYYTLGGEKVINGYFSVSDSGKSFILYTKIDKGGIENDKVYVETMTQGKNSIIGQKVLLFDKNVFPEFSLVTSPDREIYGQGKEKAALLFSSDSVLKSV